MQIMVKREISYIIIHKHVLSLFYTVPMKCYELMMFGCLKPEGFQITSKKLLFFN
ncbi:hypothetical protein HanXRQr2_Chr13g0575541 [Helianthus annuus]|uniref:Uncharacterized protein n=1 Tax=Helianthus annuus TaxID=4232 RepID=A0A9K3EFQ2_HELAN|nr:hypothetical protein HanXRQr2_Chr13g0575541 [Helianthus annuus]